MGMLADGMFFSHGLVDQQQRGNPWFHPCIKLIISWGSGHRWGGIPQGTTHSGGATWRREADHGRSGGLFSTKSAVLLLCVFLRWFWISLNDYPKEVLCVLNMTHLVGGLELTHIFIFFSEGLKPPTSIYIMKPHPSQRQQSAEAAAALLNAITASGPKEFMAMATGDVVSRAVLGFQEDFIKKTWDMMRIAWEFETSTNNKGLPSKIGRLKE